MRVEGTGGRDKSSAKRVALKKVGERGAWIYAEGRCIRVVTSALAAVSPKRDMGPCTSANGKPLYNRGIPPWKRREYKYQGCVYVC